MGLTHALRRIFGRTTCACSAVMASMRRWSNDGKPNIIAHQSLCNHVGFAGDPARARTGINCCSCSANFIGNTLSSLSKRWVCRTR